MTDLPTPDAIAAIRRFHSQPNHCAWCDDAQPCHVTSLLAAVEALTAERDDLGAAYKRILARAVEAEEMATERALWKEKYEGLLAGHNGRRVAFESLVASLGEMELRAQRAEAQRDDALARITRVEAVAQEMLGHFRKRGHVGRPCLRSDWVYVETVEVWKARLSSADREDET